MADPTIIIVTLIMVGQMVLFTPLIFIFRAGGPRASWYKLLKIRALYIKVYDHDGTPYSKLFKMSDIKTLSPPHLFFKGIIRYIDGTNFSQRSGFPENQFHIDNSLPLPIRRGYRDTILDPVTVTKAYNTDILRRMYNLGKEATPKKSGLGWKGLTLLLFFIMISIVGAIYFAFKVVGHS